MDKQFDIKPHNLDGKKKPVSQEVTELNRSRINEIEIRKWIITTNCVCPICSSHSIIKYFNSELITGCLVCGWKKRSALIQPFY